jgi:succinoglycan biosynthesis protein ExoA
VSTRRNPRWPDVSVVMPVRDEAIALGAAVESVLRQEYPGSLEVVLAVAPSGDGTDAVAERLAARDPRVRWVRNPAGTTPAGLNTAIGHSDGEVVVRLDGHAELDDGYVRLAVEVLERTGADNVGGIQQATGATRFERAVAAAMTSRFGVGDAKFHYGGTAGPTDTVYLGVFRRSALERVGGFDESLIRNQDYELNWRIRASGGVVWFDPRLRVGYRPRPTLQALARQYYEYGWWKAEVLRRHPASARWRQLVPPVAAAANVAGVALMLRGRRWAAVVPLTYLAASAVASVSASRGDPTVAARLPGVFATMHHAWAAGFISRLARLAGPRRPTARAGGRTLGR